MDVNVSIMHWSDCYYKPWASWFMLVNDWLYTVLQLLTEHSPPQCFFLGFQSEIVIIQRPAVLLWCALISFCLGTRKSQHFCVVMDFFFVARNIVILSSKIDTLQIRKDIKFPSFWELRLHVIVSLLSCCVFLYSRSAVAQWQSTVSPLGG